LQYYLGLGLGLGEKLTISRYYLQTDLTSK